MSIFQTIFKRRTIRSFKQDAIQPEKLKKLVDAARVAPQAANLQPLKYVIINDEKLLEPIFKTTAWAGYIRPAADPQEGQKPVAYILILVDSEIKKEGYDVDAGAAVENLLLTAVEEGLGTAWLGAIDRKKIKELLNIPDKYIIHTLVALGYPGENPVIEDEKDNSIRYYKDENNVLHVPKRKLEDIVFFNNKIV
ncbi:nitroreductase family protein [Clostridium pasteurianum]|uniref:Nitroreductase n=1 Tax=Clostridium pasteurianum BC1 TaxID=86416 RepID=R4KEA8_CLOPA|nr:nitroreductase family protein [Clostridium pasteurianum]AGK98899.1 nitroreductase [Clostridium pasteurianum BC1]